MLRAVCAPLVLLAFASAKQDPLKLCLVVPDLDSYYQVELGALQAVEDINNRSTALIQKPGLARAVADLAVSIEIVPQTTVLGTYDAAENCTNNGAHAIIGPAYSSRAKVLSQYLARRRHLPLVSFSATSPALSDNTTFPYFTRTVTADDAVAFAAIGFVEQMGWERVVFLFAEDIFGQGLHTACRNYKDLHMKHLQWLPVPFPADATSTDEIEAALLTIKNSDTRVVIYAGTSDTLLVMTEKAVELNIIGKGSDYTWVGFDTWSTNAAQTKAGRQALRDAMAGSIRLMASGCPGGPEENALIEKARAAADPAALSRKHGGSVGMQNYDSFDKMISMASVDCRIGFSYDGVWLAALAYASLSNGATATGGSDGRSCDEAAASDRRRGELLYAALLNTTFEGATASVRLAPSGDRDPASILVSIENLRPGGVVKYIGELKEQEAISIDKATITWADGTSNVPRSFEPVAVHPLSWERLFMIALCSLVLLVGTLCVCLHYARNRQQRAEKSHREELEQLEAEMAQTSDFDEVVRLGDVWLDSLTTDMGDHHRPVVVTSFRSGHHPKVLEMCDHLREHAGGGALKNAYFHSQSSHECSPTRTDQNFNIPPDQMKKAWTMIWFNAVFRANFVLVFNTMCSAGPTCDNIAKNCERPRCRRCSGEKRPKRGSKRFLSPSRTSFTRKSASTKREGNRISESIMRVSESITNAREQKAQADGCDAKPKKESCNGYCLRCSQNCRLELALLTSVNCKVIVINDDDDKESVVQRVNNVLAASSKSTWTGGMVPNFNWRLVTVFRQARIGAKDLDLADILHEGFSEKIARTPIRPSLFGSGEAKASTKANKAKRARATSLPWAKDEVMPSRRLSVADEPGAEVQSNPLQTELNKGAQQPSPPQTEVNSKPLV